MLVTVTSVKVRVRIGCRRSAGSPLVKNCFPANLHACGTLKMRDARWVEWGVMEPEPELEPEQASPILCRPSSLLHSTTP